MLPPFLNMLSRVLIMLEKGKVYKVKDLHYSALDFAKQLRGSQLAHYEEIFDSEDFERPYTYECKAN